MYTAFAAEGLARGGRLCNYPKIVSDNKPDREEAKVIVGEIETEGEPTPRSSRHSRYVVEPGADEINVVCKNTPNILLRVERGLTVSDNQRKKYPEQSVFLDGVFTGPPFLDNKLRQYSLDHHTGCVRAFTLATCEQAVVMLLQGLPLSEGEWTLFVNEPDLDALLAAWVLLNHVELRRDEGRLMRLAMPLIRAEGVIDAHGLDMAVLTAMPDILYQEQKAKIDKLLEPEKKLKTAGAWDATNLDQYACDRLEAIDGYIYPAGYLDRLMELEVARVSLGGSKVAILCRSPRGIYDVEAELKERYEKQLGLILLDQGAGKFTLRQVDPFLDKDLRDVYEQLNELDPESSGKDGENSWGGSDDIGGSPRKTGSGLEGEAILETIRGVFTTQPGFWKRLVGKFKSNKK